MSSDMQVNRNLPAQSYGCIEEERKKIIRDKLQLYFQDKILFTQSSDNGSSIYFLHIGLGGKKREIGILSHVTAANAATVINKLGAMLILAQNVPLINDSLVNWYIDVNPQLPNYLEIKLNILGREVLEKVYIDFGPKGESCCRLNQDGSFIFDCNPIVSQIQATTERIYAEQMKMQAASKEGANQSQSDSSSIDELASALSSLNVSARVMTNVSFGGVMKPSDLNHS